MGTVKKAFDLLIKQGPRAFKDRISTHIMYQKDIEAYQHYLSKYSCTKEELDRQRSTHFDYEPLISIVVPMYKTPLKLANEMIHSIQTQTYSNYQLCLADGTPNKSVEDAIKDYLSDPRISYQHLKENKGISENTNEAIKMAKGEYIALLDHDDLLAENALYEMVKAINEDRECEVLYSDEDKVNYDLTQYFYPHFKPDYSPDYLRSTNYICHFFMVKKELLDKVGYFDPLCNGSQDHDLILRCTEQAKKVKHIPLVLYHWRIAPGSTSENPENKMYCFEAGQRAVQKQLDRLHIQGTAKIGPTLGGYIVDYPIIDDPLVSVLIPNKDHIMDLNRCLNSILTKATYSNFEVIIIENNSTDPKTFEYYDSITDPRVKVIQYKGSFNYSKINNFGFAHSKGDYLLLLNNDTKIISPNFIELMLGHFNDPLVGVAGAKLFFENERIQHNGVILGLGGIANHIEFNLKRYTPDYFFRYTLASNVSAVTGACLMTSRELYKRLNGLNEELQVAYNDIDYCLRVREAGYRIVQEARCELYHYESKSRGYEDTPEKKERFEKESNYIKTRWHEYFENGDPYYNVNLSKEFPAFKVRK